MRLGTDVPECHMPPGQMLPQKYQKLAKRYKEFAWALKTAPNDRTVEGNGWERVDGSSMYNWFQFSRIDINNDGYCDWYLNASAPMSTGGDSDSINTIYLGQKNGWLRIGASIPDNKPDQLGSGNAYDEQKRYLFGDEVGVLHDASAKINYLITAFDNRNVQHQNKPGYRIFIWDSDKKTLRLLDKWEPGSKAAEVYGFFKAHGAWVPAPTTVAPADRILHFDPQVEAFELEQACNPASPQRSFPENNGPVSRYLLARCKH
jgi:hypothetical protein